MWARCSRAWTFAGNSGFLTGAVWKRETSMRINRIQGHERKLFQYNHCTFLTSQCLLNTQTRKPRPIRRRFEPKARREMSHLRTWRVRSKSICVGVDAYIDSSSLSVYIGFRWPN